MIWTPRVRIWLEDVLTWCKQTERKCTMNKNTTIVAFAAAMLGLVGTGCVTEGYATTYTTENPVYTPAYTQPTYVQPAYIEAPPPAYINMTVIDEVPPTYLPPRYEHRHRPYHRAPAHHGAIRNAPPHRRTIPHRNMPQRLQPHTRPRPQAQARPQTRQQPQPRTTRGHGGKRRSSKK